MLKLFRKKIVSKIILWGLLILILPAFVMWGSASTSRSKDKGPNNAGIINGKKVSFDELYNAISGVRTQIILNYYSKPVMLETLLKNKPLLAKIAWDRLLLLNEAKKFGITVPDKDVIASIKEHPLFLKNGVFDDKFYSYMLRNNIGLDPRAFEEIVRDNLKIQRLSSRLTRDMKVPDEDVASEYRKEFVKLRISYVLLEPKDAFDQARVEEKAVKDFYEKHKGEMMVRSNAAGTQGERVATFDESKETIEKFLKEAEARKLLEAKSNDVYSKITEGVGSGKETFEGAALRLKLPAKSAGLFSRNDTLNELSDLDIIADAALELKEREISKPLETAKGFIIFEVTQKQAPDDEALKKEKDEYSKKVRERKIDAFMEDYLRKLEDVSKPAIKFEDIEKYYR